MAGNAQILAGGMRRKARTLLQRLEGRQGRAAHCAKAFACGLARAEKMEERVGGRIGERKVASMARTSRLGNCWSLGTDAFWVCSGQGQSIEGVVERLVPARLGRRQPAKQCSRLEAVGAVQERMRATTAIMTKSLRLRMRRHFPASAMQDRWTQQLQKLKVPEWMEMKYDVYILRSG